MIGESPTRPNLQSVMPPVLVPAARLPLMSRQTETQIEPQSVARSLSKLTASNCAVLRLLHVLLPFGAAILRIKPAVGNELQLLRGSELFSTRANEHHMLGALHDPTGFIHRRENRLKRHLLLYPS
jgi:hypothetical protein